MAFSAPSIRVDTSNSTESLKRLFSCGAADGRFFIPFAHTPRYLTMKHDASRSIIQSTIQRWASSGSVVTCDPTGFLDISSAEEEGLLVAPGRHYPLGLGIGESGFALNNESRVSIPIISFAVWFGRQTPIPVGQDPAIFLVEDMIRELGISPVEKEVVFVDDDIVIDTQSAPRTDDQLYKICAPFIDGSEKPTVKVFSEDFSHYNRRVNSMVSGLNMPAWMRSAPEQDVRALISLDAKSILLYGPPRTGKTRLIDSIIPRADESRCTIQIHDGWGYDHLVEGFKPDADGNWAWTDGPLKIAIESGKSTIVLEEINRTAISQALGEVFSLIEDNYRGEANGIVLRSGKKFSIPKETLFLLTMNTIDKSTEDIDDALLGRIAAVEFPPRPEDLVGMLTEKGMPEAIRSKLSQVFAEILTIYPLGHGYFAALSKNPENMEIIHYYKARIRPVLVNFLGDLKHQEVEKIDNLIDEMFATSV
ncbi:AAA family ATPase [Geothrix terrae]|uniref:AAA family ATPase n=1 Tax=Geothrix terrae TaxID=2922720 RepID=UPI001FAC83A2|nr:AAA family ATPase [Geothrix terrae]